MPSALPFFLQAQYTEPAKDLTLGHSIASDFYITLS